MVKYVCMICGWVYDPQIGDPQHGIPAGTKWESVPEDWTCPVCAAVKDDFEPEE